MAANKLMNSGQAVIAADKLTDGEPAAIAANKPADGRDAAGRAEALPAITVLGVGNILLTDEGLGVHVVTEMNKEYTCIPPVRFLDGGTMGMEIMAYMEDTEYLLLVDAIHGDGEPGTVYEFHHEELENYFTDHVSVHEVGIQDILRIRALQEEPFRSAVVIGVEPLSLEVGLEVSPVVQAALPEVKQRIIERLKTWQVEVQKKDE